MPLSRRVALFAGLGLPLTGSLGLAACSSPLDPGGSGTPGSSAASGSAGSTAYELVTPGVLTVGSISDGSPNAFIDTSGNFTGFDVELLRAMGSTLGLDVQFTAIDFSNLLPSLVNGQFDVGAAGVSITDGRKETVDFTNSIYFAFLGIIAREGEEYTSFEQLEGKTVVVANGTIQDEYATSQLGLEPIRFPDQTAAFQALMAGQGDAYLAPFGTGGKFLDQYPDSGLAMVYSQLNSRNTIAYAVAKTNPELTAALDEALDTAIEDGTWQELVDQFYPDAEIPTDFSPGSDTVEFTRP